MTNRKSSYKKECEDSNLVIKYIEQLVILLIRVRQTEKVQIHTSKKVYVLSRLLCFIVTHVEL